MAISKLLVLWIAFSIAIVGVRAESDANEEEIIDLNSPLKLEIDELRNLDSRLKLEIDELRAKISCLESSLSDKTQELKNKDESISSLEKVVHEKSAGISALQTEIESLKKKEVVVAEEQVGKALSRAGQLEKEVGELKAKIEVLTQENKALEGRASEAKKKVKEHEMQLQSLERTNEDQRRRIQKTERALQVAEEELMRAQLEATSKSKVLSEIHGAWLPPWLAKHISHLQEIGATHWNEHGKPSMDVLLKQASEKSTQVQKWAEPHLETAKNKWIPAVKDKWMTFTTYVGPYMETVSTRSVEVYEVCRSTITPHFVKVHELAVPYVQEARRISKPHIDQIATLAKPHVEKVRFVLKPYTSRIVYAYGKFLESATTYHHQVQGAVHEKLKNYELTKHLATKEFVWFMASAVLALPVFFLYKIFSAMFCKKASKPSNAHANHGHRRHKRRHVDK